VVIWGDELDDEEGAEHVRTPEQVREVIGWAQRNAARTLAYSAGLRMQLECEQSISDAERVFLHRSLVRDGLLRDALIRRQQRPDGTWFNPEDTYTHYRGTGMTQAEYDQLVRPGSQAQRSALTPSRGQCSRCQHWCEGPAAYPAWEA